ncbi:MAG: Trk system potassium transporter TrkA [Clostridiales bacterium]|nr:Trk system potassium transporter TrkA [Clostridiales bacterium]
MKIVIVGDGKVGFSLAKELSKENHDIILIDSNPKVLEKSAETLDVMVVHGNGASLDTLRYVNIGETDIIIAATSSDEINMLCCILANKLGCRNSIARFRNPEYTSQLRLMNKDLGISMAINPEFSAAREIFRILQFPSFLKRDSFAKGRVELVELKITTDSKLVNKRLDQLYRDLHMHVLICAVERNEEVIIPNGAFVLMPGDKITVTAKRADLAELIYRLDIGTKKIKNVLIIGGSSIAVYLAEDLINLGINVKIIERDYDKCLELAQKLPKALIINDDGSRQDVLIAEGIKTTDAVVSLTNLDEENLIISMFVDSLGNIKTVTKIKRSEYTALFSNKGIGSIVCPKDLVVHEIIRYVRAKSNTTEGSVLTLNRIANQKAEALEFMAQSTTKHLNTPLMNIKLKKNILIVSISRAGNIIIPRGNDYISAGDNVIIIAPTERTITDLNDIFEE